MNRRQAIEILEKFWGSNFRFRTGKLLEASRLGLEALKRLEAIRDGQSVTAADQLPGETAAAEIQGPGGATPP